MNFQPKCGYRLGHKLLVGAESSPAHQSNVSAMVVTEASPPQPRHPSSFALQRVLLASSPARSTTPDICAGPHRSDAGAVKM